MTICANPESRRIKVQAGQDFVICVFKEPTTDQYTKFVAAVTAEARKQKDSTRIIAKKFSFFDQLITGLEGRSASGEPEVVEYRDDNGEMHALTPDVQNWTKYIHPAWKLAAVSQLEGQFETEEENAVKN